MIRTLRHLTAVLADSACCHLINFINWRLPDRTNSPVELANYVARCKSLSRPEFYSKEPIKGLHIEPAFLSWSSPIESGFSENDMFRARVFLSSQGWSAPAVILLHALMSASDFGYQHIARRFNQVGWNAVLVHLPFHYTRIPPGYLNGALALTSELIRNAETIRQAVMEIRQLLELLRTHGADRFGLISTSYGGWIGSVLLSLEEDFEFAALLQPLVDIEEAIWNSPAALAIRSRLRRHLIEPGISRQHAHLSCPFAQKPLVDPNRIHLLAGEFDQIVPVKTLQRFAETWNVPNLEIVPQGHFGYVAMNRVLRRLGLVLVLVVVLVLESGVATDLRCMLV
jgi:pimeloyl-ACP methyl ester carboxylesterase